MKHLKEIDPVIYEADRDMRVDRTDIADETNALFVARFWASKFIVEGLVSVRSVSSDRIDFQQVTDDGELVGKPYAVNITASGIMDAITLRDVSVIHACEGYFKQYGSSLDDELEALIADQERDLVPVHVTLGGAAGDLARQELVETRG